MPGRGTSLLRERAGHALVDRRLYLGEAWAGDDERRELAGVPDETAFATKPQLAGDMLEDAHASGIRTAWVAADEVYGGREDTARVALQQLRWLQQAVSQAARSRKGSRGGRPPGFGEKRYTRYDKRGYTSASEPQLRQPSPYASEHDWPDNS